MVSTYCLVGLRATFSKDYETRLGVIVMNYYYFICQSFLYARFSKPGLQRGRKFKYPGFFKVKFGK